MSIFDTIRRDEARTQRELEARRVRDAAEAEVKRRKDEDAARILRAAYEIRDKCREFYDTSGCHVLLETFSSHIGASQFVSDLPSDMCGSNPSDLYKAGEQSKICFQEVRSWEISSKKIGEKNCGHGYHGKFQKHYKSFRIETVTGFISASMYANGCLVIRGDHEHRVPATEWRRNQQAIERAIDAAYRNPRKIKRSDWTGSRCNRELQPQA